VTRLQRLRDLAERLQDSFDAKYLADAQGAAALARLLKSTWVEIEELEQRDATTLEATPEPQYTQMLEEAAEAWPDHHLEAILRVYERRHQVRHLLLVESGS